MLGGSLAWQWRLLRQGLARATRLSTRSRRYERREPSPRRRVLIAGDSTGVGVGASRPEDSVAGLIGAEFPAVEVVNRCESGARVADAIEQLATVQRGPADGERRRHPRRFDLLLLHVGGNDVLRGTRLDRLEAQSLELLAQARRIARRTLWLGSADLGAAPLFVPPLSWWMSRRTRSASANVFGRCAAKASEVALIDFSAPEASRLFASDRARYFAPDGVHPSSASYRHCWDVVRTHRFVVETLAP